LILSNELLSKAIDRINELQNDTIQKADRIEGSRKYIEEQMKLFKEAEEHRKMLNAVVCQQNLLSEKFIK
jgi:hypothetical protein